MTTRLQNNFTAKPQKYTIIQTTNKARDKKNRKTIMSNLAKNPGNINADSSIMSTGLGVIAGATLMKMFDTFHNSEQPEPSQLFRDINTDNDNTLSSEEMLDYYGTKSGSHLTDYTILQKYKKFGSINIDNEKEKLQEWNTMMCLDKQEADKISSLLDKNGTTFGGFLGLGGTKFFTDEDLIKLGLSGKTIEIIKKYDSTKNNGNNDGKISKEEAINAAIVGGASFKTNTLTQETRNLFNHLGGKDNIVTENGISILKKLGYDPKEVYDAFKINVGNKSGIVLGDFENVANEIDLDKINAYIDTWPDNIKQEFLSMVDKDGDGKISSKDELCAAIDCIDLFKDRLETDILRNTNFTFTTRDGLEHNIIQVFNKHLDNENHFKYDKDHNKFIQRDKEDVNKIRFDNEQTKDILTNGREFIDIGSVTLEDGRTFEGIALLDDNMKNAIAKTYGKEKYEDCNEEEIENFTKKWQCRTQNDVYNLGALINNIIIPDTLFGNESIISVETFNEKTIAGFDKTGEAASILDYLDGKQDGYIDKRIFTDEIVVNGTTLKMDKNDDGFISADEFYSFIGETKNAIGETQLKDILHNASSMNLENINQPNKGQNTYNE